MGHGRHRAPSRSPKDSRSTSPMMSPCGSAEAIYQSLYVEGRGALCASREHEHEARPGRT
jgi:hypothetical protein